MRGSLGSERSLAITRMRPPSISTRSTLFNPGAGMKLLLRAPLRS